MQALPTPRCGPDAAGAWIDDHLADLASDEAPPSPNFRGGQPAADAALAAYDVGGYAATRNEVWPPARRGASRLSPYIRHGLLPLPRVWDAVEAGPAADVRKFRDELLWQEYARHLYARLGYRLRRPLRATPAVEPGSAAAIAVWPRDMECIRTTVDELEADGWITNQTRMWLASQWSVRAGAAWQAGEAELFRHLLDGSAAANLLGWQWTVGAASSKPYGFSRWQVEKRAPGLCQRCKLGDACPIQGWPSPRRAAAVSTPRALKSDSDLKATRGPRTATVAGEPEIVWLTAESLGDADPALAAHPDLPVAFVFDAARLQRWRLSRKRLAFLVETLAEFGVRRDLRVYRGDPTEVLGGQRLAATFTPVPGWRMLREKLTVVAIHPWPWLRWPHAGSLQSYSAWRKQLKA